MTEVHTLVSPQRRAQQDVVKRLKELLKRAEDGEIDAVICCYVAQGGAVVGHVHSRSEFSHHLVASLHYALSAATFPDSVEILDD